MTQLTEFQYKKMTPQALVARFNEPKDTDNVEALKAVMIARKLLAEDGQTLLAPSTPVVVTVKGKAAQKTEKAPREKKEKVKKERKLVDDPKFRKITDVTAVYNDLKIGDSVDFRSPKDKYGFEKNQVITAKIIRFEQLRGTDRIYLWVEALTPAIEGEAAKTKCFGVSIAKVVATGTELPAITEKAKREKAEPKIGPNGEVVVARTLSDEQKAKMKAGREAKKLSKGVSVNALADAEAAIAKAQSEEPTDETAEDTVADE